MIKCPCGKATKGGKMFCDLACQKIYRSNSFRMNQEKKAWEKKNGRIQDFK